MALPAPRGGKKAMRTGRGLPEPTGGGDFDPFLNASVFGKLGAKGKVAITGEPEDSSGEFSDIQVPCKVKGDAYSWGMRFNSGNYARLYGRFGSNPKKWRGTVNVEVKMFKKKLYVAVVS